MTGAAPPEPHVVRYGTGPRARRQATAHADRLWRDGIAARAVFRPDLGGWAVLVYSALRRHPGT